MNDQRLAQRTPEYRILGPLEAEVDGRQLELGPPKQRALLVALLMRGGEAVPVERLIDDLWPENPPDTARHAIQVYVSRLRRLLDPPNGPTQIVAHSRAYELRVAPEAVDLWRFRQLVERGRAELADDPRTAATVLGEAVGLWRGRALADLDGEAGVRDVVLELEELRRDALELKVGAELASGQAGELVPRLERLVGDYPAHEEFRAQLMLALYRSGRQQDALDEYGRARQALLHELGLEPAPRLRELQAAILRQDSSLIVEPRELRARRHLPAQPNAFVGRERELADLTELVGSRGVRLVTLTGPGGVGKTRLAIAAGDRLASSFRDGVFFVSLVDVQTPDLIEPAIARALDVRADGLGPLQTLLIDRLQDRELLLVVDNFEHVAEGAIVVSTLLKQVPRLKVLATSRVRLDLYGESRYEVPPLALPTAGERDLARLAHCDAVALFTVRAREVQFNFELTHENASAASSLCIALEGLPLAIELAAARTDALGPAALLERLSDRLDLLAGGPRDVADRQRTLRATIAWSYDLLAESEQLLFRRLSVFAAGCTLEAAQEVCDAELDALASLVDKSLIRKTGERFVMLETVREYALERLEASGTSNDLRRRHAEHFAGLAEAAEPELTGPEQTAWMQRLEAEHDNLRAALTHLLDLGESERALSLSTALFRFWYQGSYFSEGRRWLTATLESSDQLPPRLRAKALNGAGAMAQMQGDMAAAKELQEQSLQLWRASGDKGGIARALGDLALIAVTARDWPRGTALFAESAALFDEIGDEWGSVLCANNLATVHVCQGDLNRAIEGLDDALRRARALENDDLLAQVLQTLGQAFLARADHERSRDSLREAVPLCHSTGDLLALAQCFEGIAYCAVEEGRTERGARLFGAADNLLDRVGAEPFSDERALMESYRARAQAAAGDEQFNRARDDGGALSLEQAIEYALSED